ncbi:hypothetical protein EOE18_02875 [Novosphingobium umbonatum]|uniref:DUF2269 family protein n=1 Tax=Novosphingobium umbonatum TaxID=1908524 RepID=A0A437NAG7_9SPHN|nr:hypothetical protein [Novosphingobium umbonatum]RVU06919.1 hypothetical protein EOE18_02875 [Novosphingobium umbonatum]
MDLTLTALTLLHILVPIYWLGGDLGAFYSARFLINPARSVPERMLALTILNNIDMAPRTTLILAFPTGFTLGVAKGWLAVPPVWLGPVWLGFLTWLALAWAVHVKHGPAGAAYKRMDIAVRYIVLAALAVAGLAGIAGVVAMPLFIALKLLVLAACIVIGLVVRVQLVPLFPAIIAMKSTGATPETDAIIARVLGRTTPTVQVIWVLVLVACFLGLGTPV